MLDAASRHRCSSQEQRPQGDAPGRDQKRWAKRSANNSNASAKTLLLLAVLAKEVGDGKWVEPDRGPSARKRKDALRAVEEPSLATWDDGRVEQLFSGISLGSILLLAALGLAITYGLMGVINMAHGELIMIGAYATYVVQNLFRSYLPGAFDYYLLAALPAAFCLLPR